MKTNWLTQKNRLDWLINAARAISGCMPGAVFYATLGPSAGDVKMFRVTQDVAALELDFIIEASGGSGSVAIEDPQTGKALWRRDVGESVIFTQPVGPLKKEREYILRFTGKASEPTRVTVSSQSGVVREVPLPSPPMDRPCLVQV